MKVLAFVILIIGSSSGLGSGPYLPSGWRPSGPAFSLPTEVEKPASVKVEAVIQETETSGSAFLKEYGPPKLEVEVETSETDSLKEYGAPEPVKVELEVSQDLTQQALPEVITEQAFISANLVEEDKSAIAEVVETTIVENSETIVGDDTETATQDITEDSVTESAKIQDKTSEVLIVDSQTESTATVQNEALQENVEVKQEEVAQNEQEVTQNSSAVVEEKIEEEVVSGVHAVEAGVKNIAEAIVSLENEVKAQKVEEIPELRTVQQNTESIQGPEGFLEYGPPGFTEYGPPKGDLKTKPVVESLPASETNETRRRRFSPKFKAPKRKN